MAEFRHKPFLIASDIAYQNPSITYVHLFPQKLLEVLIISLKNHYNNILSKLRKITQATVTTLYWEFALLQLSVMYLTPLWSLFQDHRVFLNGIEPPVFTGINYTGSYSLNSEKSFSDLLRSWATRFSVLYWFHRNLLKIILFNLHQLHKSNFKSTNSFEEMTEPNENFGIFLEDVKKSQNS